MCLPLHTEQTETRQGCAFCIKLVSFSSKTAKAVLFFNCPFTSIPCGYKINPTGKTSYHSPIGGHLSTQAEWISPQKPTDLAEQQLLTAILDGRFPVGSPLPPERDLSQSLGVTRPTLRETLQRLSRDGWIQIRQGKSTVVRDYWKDGNLIMLNALSRQPDLLTPTLILNLLEVRVTIAPEYARLAVSRANKELSDFLQAYLHLPDMPAAFAQADHELHHQLTVLSGNPIYTLIYNGFRPLSYRAGLDYFNSPETRAHSLNFYKGLLQDALNNQATIAAERTAQVMQASLEFWRKTALL